MKELLDKLVDNIEFQRIKLTNINLETDDKIGGIFLGQEIERELNIKLLNIQGGQEVSDNEEKEIVTAHFEFELIYKNNNNNLVSLKASYNVIIGFKEKINKMFKEDEARKIIPNFFNNSGRVMVYPYFRNTADMLIREAGFVFEPIPPLKIN